MKLIAAAERLLAVARSCEGMANKISGQSSQTRLIWALKVER